MESHNSIDRTQLHKLLLRERITFAGNRKLKIYGTLHCASGKRMKKENRIFFVTEKEALENRYRPCGHCLRKQYTQWKLVQ
jgi:methylphosphotriester-DNA--protein-cysteine methyltransferase